ncbi:MAG: nicotinate-nucleotide adenylyltransferase [Candidatus Nanopelagicales bacterium]
MVNRVGVMGGTFDPIHFGHLLAASEVCFRLDLDQVIFVPTGEPWQKSDRVVSDPTDRLRMTELATDPDPRFCVSRVDVDRSGPTFTVDTLRDLAVDLAPDSELFFIAGADTLTSINTWRDAGELADLARFVAVSRPGHQLTNASDAAVDVELVEIPGLSISSSECRRRVSAGEPIDYLVPAAVVDFIGDSGLYLDVAQ